MLYPSIDSLTDMFGSKFSIVIMAAMRARQLQAGAKRLSNVETSRNVTIALNEIHDKQISFYQTTEIPRRTK
ncbi:DNA-directed RNA polymerase subunit omega [Alicyclobacillus dauci]|uniref:DNA-directed RNA polymerase subunit omega n=1 Tax=Alicyclobacillus dauci TaxID=1475485 RepID=A0ABY6YXY9_9BACL|nr:DNA-directed RNA polymerase subunit omega [Alicyclobacillus dauci]WAH35287.1 DNA-directed RNA polymerase subunit omega [Alicyclobacillus dauci]WAH36243.1 DNA-directed RNA polymerase subunit omega [Alicyclobacillus dauci]